MGGNWYTLLGPTYFFTNHLSLNLFQKQLINQTNYDLHAFLLLLVQAFLN